MEAVYNAICAGFYTVPDYCKKYLNTNDINNPDLILMKSGNKRHSYLKTFFLCQIVMIIICAMMYCYRRSAKRNMQVQMKEQVESAVNQYLALRNVDKEAEGRASKSEMTTFRSKY